MMVVEARAEDMSLSSVSTNIAVDGQLANPSAIAVSPLDGRIVVADEGNDRIHVFHPNGTFAFAFGSYGVGDGQFRAPSTVAVAPDGRIVVADGGNDGHDRIWLAGDSTRYRIQVFHPNGTFAFAFGSYGNGSGQFLDPTALAVSPLDGRIVVADDSNFDIRRPNHRIDDRIQVFHPNGTLSHDFLMSVRLIITATRLHSPCPPSTGASWRWPEWTTPMTVY